MPSPNQLLAIIQTSLTTLEQICSNSGTHVPEVDEPFTPLSEAFRADPVAAQAAQTASAAALHLAAMLTPPQVSLYHIVGGGLHIKEIATKNGQDPDKLGRFIRFLAVNHVYREVSPDVFANTRISSMLDTLKPTADLFAHPEDKYDGTIGLAALASHQ
ncbi:hypothetical protein EVG20_g4606 [Dentipellis fragilis]|uniref:O-methyltransferase domain-containing protein n=1 Tax=Dentipellis fragilis TaxID=205917 RepID=A0A4Y9YWA2_9AGAM|nr:hypothetical protein EVG20_g4606 [Dentipellis fragilis]